MLATFVAPLLAGLYWKRATRAGASSSMLAGFVTSIFFDAVAKFGPFLPPAPHRLFHYLFYQPLPVHFSLYSFLVSAAVLVVVSLLTPPPPLNVLQKTETCFFTADQSS